MVALPFIGHLMKKAVLSLLLTASTFSLRAQTEFFTLLDHLGPTPANIQQTFDGGYITASDLESVLDTVFHLSHYYLIKFNALGLPVWQKEWATSSFDAGGSKAAVCQTADSGYAVAGCYLSGSFQHARNELLVVKTDSLGNHLWSYRYPGLGRSQAQGISSTSDGGLIVCGLTVDTSINDQYGFLLKLNADGTLQWSKCYSSPGWTSELTTVHPTTDGGYILSGRMNGGGGVLKTDSLGAVEWCNTYGWNFIFRQAKEAPDGGFIATGTQFYTNYFIPVVTRFSPGGVPQWSNSYSRDTSSASMFDQSYDVVAEDSGYTVTLSHFEPLLYQGMIMHTDIAGTPVWAYRYHASGLEPCLARTTSGYVTASRTPRTAVFTTDSSGQNCNSVPVSEYASPYPLPAPAPLTVQSCPTQIIPHSMTIWGHWGGFSQPCAVVVGVDETLPERAVSVYPNPAGEQLTVTWSDGNAPTVISLVSATGATVYTSQANSGLSAGSHTIPVSSLAEGLYFLRLDNGESTPTRKVVIAR